MIGARGSGEEGRQKSNRKILKASHSKVAVGGYWTGSGGIGRG